MTLMRSLHLLTAEGLKIGVTKRKVMLDCPKDHFHKHSTDSLVTKLENYDMQPN